MDKCLICNEPVSADNHFFRKHRMSAEVYYHTHYPRYDLFNNELIPFKDKARYFSQNFVNKENLRQWLASQDSEVVKDYLKSLLIDRKTRKGLVYTPSQVELRSLHLFPSIYTYNKFFPDYFKLCEELGFKNKVSRPQIFYGQVKKYKVTIDTREQQPLDFPSAKITSHKLEYGDYYLSSDYSDEEIYIERKSLPDFVGTFTAGVDRFKKEIIRAQEDNKYLVVLVEAKLDDALNFKKVLTNFKNFKVSTDYVFRNVRDIIQEFPNVQFLFVDGRDEAVYYMEKLLYSFGTYKDVDLQFAYDTNTL